MCRSGREGSNSAPAHSASLCSRSRSTEFPAWLASATGEVLSEGSGSGMPARYRPSGSMVASAAKMAA